MLLVAVGLFPQAGVSSTTAVIGDTAPKTSQPAVCEGGFYVVRGRQLIRFGSDGVQHRTISQLPLEVNALAYARDQHLFYAIGTDRRGARVITIDEAGHARDRGPAPRGTRDAYAGAISGSHWYVRGGGDMAVVNIQPGHGFLTVSRKVRLSAHPYLGDWEINPADGDLYGIDTAGFGAGRLVKVSTSSGRVTVVAKPQGLLGNGYGAVAIYGGVLHALHNATGRMVHIPLGSPQKLTWSTVGLAGLNADAASCPRPAVPPPPPVPPPASPAPSPHPSPSPKPKPRPPPTPQPRPNPAQTYYQPDPTEPPATSPAPPSPSPSHRFLVRVTKPFPQPRSQLPLTFAVFLGLLVPALIVAARGAAHVASAPGTAGDLAPHRPERTAAMIVLFTGIGVVVLAAGISVVGFLLISKYVPERWLVADADAAGALYASIGMVYAILIAIAAIAVWEPHTDAREATSQEAADLIEIQQLSSQLPAASRPAIHRLTVTYTESVVASEWPALHDTHAQSPESAALFQQLRTAIEQVNPSSNQEQSAYDAVLGRISDAADARRTRISAADKSMPPLLWPVLIISSLVSVGFLYLFGLDRTFPNGIMMATVGGMIALVLFVIFQIEYPFSRALAIDPAPFILALQQIGGS